MRTFTIIVCVMVVGLMVTGCTSKEAAADKTWAKITAQSKIAGEKAQKLWDQYPNVSVQEQNRLTTEMLGLIPTLAQYWDKSTGRFEVNDPQVQQMIDIMKNRK
jgi:hypothetical protein